MHRGIVLCTLLLFAFEGQVRGLPDDADQPIHFRADSVEGDLLVGGPAASTTDDASAEGFRTGTRARRVVATGSVQIDQGSMRLEADRVIIESDDDRITLIDAEGDPARYRQQPEPGADFLKAHAANIIYHPVDARIELIGRAWLARDSDEFRGEVIKYDMRQGKVEAFGEEHGVEMILQPESPQPGSARGHPSQGKSPQPGSARGRPSQERSPQPGSARGHPSQGKSPQPGSARGHPSQERSPQPGSARGHPSQERSPQPGSARGVPSQDNSNPSGHPPQDHPPQDNNR